MKNFTLIFLAIISVFILAQCNRSETSQTTLLITPFTIHEAMVENFADTTAFIDTQINIIKSDQTLATAIDTYNLTTLLGKDRDALFDFILKSLEIKKLQDSELITITTKSDTEQFAKIINYSLIKGYELNHAKRIADNKNSIAQRYKTLIIKHKSLVEDSRFKLFKLSKKLGIPYVNAYSTHTLLHKESDTIELTELTNENLALFQKAKDDYEREFAILQSLKNAEFKETIIEEIEIEHLQFHQKGWTEEIATMMEARRKK